LLWCAQLRIGCSKSVVVILQRKRATLPHGIRSNPVLFSICSHVETDAHDAITHTARKVEHCSLRPSATSSLLQVAKYVPRSWSDPSGFATSQFDQRSPARA